MEENPAYFYVKNNRWVGSKYEDMASKYLKEQGFRILCRNFNCAIGEIDLICTEKVKYGNKETEYLVFVEVKYRSTARKGYASEAVKPSKQRKILQCAQFYLKKFEIPLFTPIRFDVVAIDGTSIHLIRNAFGSM